MKLPEHPIKMGNEESKVLAGLSVKNRELEIAKAKMYGAINRTIKYYESKNQNCDQYRELLNDL